MWRIALLLRQAVLARREWYGTRRSHGTGPGDDGDVISRQLPGAGHLAHDAEARAGL
jgi:hypothetical protein